MFRAITAVTERFGATAMLTGVRSFSRMRSLVNLQVLQS